MRYKLLIVPDAIKAGATIEIESENFVRNLNLYKEGEAFRVHAITNNPTMETLVEQFIGSNSGKEIKHDSRTVH